MSVLRTIAEALGSDEFRVVIESIKDFIRMIKKRGN